VIIFIIHRVLTTIIQK